MYKLFIFVLFSISSYVRGQIVTNDFYLKSVDDSVTVGCTVLAAELFFKNSDYIVKKDSNSLLVYSSQHDSLVCVTVFNEKDIITHLTVYKDFNLEDPLPRLGSIFKEEFLMKYDKVGVSGDLGDCIFIYDSKNEYEIGISLIFEPNQGVDVIRYEYEPEKLLEELKKSRLSSYFISCSD